jgi:SHS2 domain-containing protein
MTERAWEHFPHGADIGIRGYGPTLEAAFEEAARAMSAIVVDPAEIEPRQRVEIACSAPDREILLVDWLNTLIYEMDVRGVVFGDYHVHIENGRLTAMALGEALDADRHTPAVEIKGATFSEVRVVEDETGGWVAQCVIDV